MTQNCKTNHIDRDHGLVNLSNIRCFGPHLVPISAAEGPHLVPISLKIRSQFGPHFEKFRSPFHVGAVPSLRNMKKCLLRTERAYFACFLKL